MTQRIGTPATQTTMTARYAGTCGRCGAELAVGDTIAYAGETRTAYCPECGAADLVEQQARFDALPAITGDDRLWLYAVEARADIIQEIDLRIAERLPRLAKQVELGREPEAEEHRRTIAYLERGRAALLAQTDAGWWAQAKTLGSSKAMRDLIGTIRDPK